MGLVRQRGAKIVNVDAVIVAEEPKMGPHVPAMKAALSAVLGIAETALGIKAKTTRARGRRRKRPSLTTPSPHRSPDCSSPAAELASFPLAAVIHPSRPVDRASPSRCRLDHRFMLAPGCLRLSSGLFDCSAIQPRIHGHGD
jgi:hypothetical protein